MNDKQEIGEVCYELLLLIGMGTVMILMIIGILTLFTL